MSFNKSLALESFIVSFLILLVGVLWKVVQGYIANKKYVPDVIKKYESVDYLQSTVSFGTIQTPFNWTTVLFMAAGFVVIALIYYVMRLMLIRML